MHYGSVSDPDSISAALYNVDAVVHLVAVIRERGSATFEAINHRGARNVAHAAAQAGVKHLVHVGAIGSVDDARLPYLYSKWRGEQAVMESGVPYTIIQGVHTVRTGRRVCKLAGWTGQSLSGGYGGGERTKQVPTDSGG